MTSWNKQREHRTLTGRPWRRLVEQVKARDLYTCQKCGRVTEEGECDHRIPVHLGGTDTLDNLQWLCTTPCHEEKTRAEAQAAQGIKAKTRIGEDGWPL